MEKQMKVQLLAYTPNPEAVVATAAKLCYSDVEIEELLRKSENSDNEKFIKMLKGMGHESPFEHVNFTFGIEGVSRALLAQITRHRIASYSVQSQRYVNLGDFDFIVPPEIDKSPEMRETYLKDMRSRAVSYLKLYKSLRKHYLIVEERPKKEAEKQALEDARFVLPNACATKMLVTMNARSLMNFFNLRCCNRAQWEIHALADEMLRLVKEVAPNIFKDCGPNCVCGCCPEGEKCCGKMTEVREKYKV